MNQTFIDKISLKTTLWYAHNLPFINDERKLHTNEMDVIVCWPHYSPKASYMLNDRKILSLFSIIKPLYSAKNRKLYAHSKSTIMHNT